MSISIQELEKIRLNFKLRRKINNITFFLVPAICIPLMVYANYNGFGDNSDTVFYVALTILVLNVIRNILVWAYTSIKFENMFKEGVLEDLVHSLLPEINYDSKGHISMKVFMESGLFTRVAGKRLTGTDYFSGSLGSMKFELSLLTNRKKRKRDKRVHSEGVDTNTNTATPIFSGIFMVATLPHPVQEPLYIMPKIRSANKIINTLADKLDFNYLPEVEEIPLTDLDLEGNFTVLCNDITQARDLLKPKMIEEIVNLNLRYPYNVFISYLDNKVYCAIDKFYKFFDVSLNLSVLDTESQKGLFKDLNNSLKTMNLLSAN
jgi:hypothetical protein